VGLVPDARAEQVKGLAGGAADWLVEHPDTAGDPSLYNGSAGVVLALQEAAKALVEPRYGRAAAKGLDKLVAAINDVQDSSLYFGSAGVAFAVWALGSPDEAMQALGVVRSCFDGQRWGPMFELLGGNAGVGLAALHAGDLELAVMAVVPYLALADRTAHGVNWPVRPTPPRSHHLAHGTLGIVCALAAIGDGAGRDDLVELALAGAADVVSRNEAGADGFLVAHSDPPHCPDLIERYSSGWCNGPAGDAQVFRLLAKVTEDPEWAVLVDRCWHTVTKSGLPRRVRPGFWDNNGRCCGTEPPWRGLEHSAHGSPPLARDARPLPPRPRRQAPNARRPRRPPRQDEPLPRVRPQRRYHCHDGATAQPAMPFIGPLSEQAPQRQRGFTQSAFSEGRAAPAAGPRGAGGGGLALPRPER
jgi:hypothetical protein